MARLRQLRMISVGHTNARFRDVTLDFTLAGQPEDSTLWLRNGGGKSSLLSLFFGLLRPDLREFLGAQADARQRRLEHYIGKDDRSVVAAEWQLDDARPGEPGPRFLTGVFYEWKSTGDLRKLWFSGLVSADDQRLTLGGLPLFTEGGRRRLLTGFREEWATLRTRYPELQLTYTEVQREWADTLRGAGIDPELFAYQLRMNTREGGADELFRFSSHEKFVDFLLELAYPAAKADEVSKNISQYREQLRRRTEEYIPERDLIGRLVSQIQPLVQVSAERKDLLDRARDGRGDLQALLFHLDARTSALTTASEEAEARRLEAIARQDKAAAQALDARKRAASLAWWAASEKHRQTLADRDEIDRRFKEADAQRKLWAAAAPLRDALGHAEAAADYRTQLDRQQKEHEPLLEELRQTAAAYAGALDHAVERARNEKEAFLMEERTRRASADEARTLARHRQDAAARQEARASVLRQQLETARRERRRLEDADIIGVEEGIDAAIERLTVAIAAATETLTRLDADASRLESDARTTQQRVLALEGDRARTRQELTSLEREMASATAARDALESDVLLQRLLETDKVDLEGAGRGVDKALAEAIARLTTSLTDRRSQLAAGERERRHLEVEGLLPPSPEVTAVLELLRGRIPSVRSGWTEIATNGPPAPGDRRKIVLRYPQVATGVVVRDVDWEQACALLADEPMPTVPVLVARQGALDGPPVDGFVFGPSSDAHFDREAAAREAERRGDEARRLQGEIDGIQSELARLDDVNRRYQGLRARWPLGWVAEQQDVIATLRREIEAIEAEIAGVGEALTLIAAQQDAVTRERAATQQRERHAGLHRAEVVSFQRQHGGALTEASVLLRQAEDAASAARTEAEEALVAGAKREADANESATRARARSEDLARLDQDRGRVRYVDRSEPRDGDVAALAEAYERKLTLYEQKVGAAGLLVAVQQAEAYEAAARRRFRDLVKAPLTEDMVAEALGRLASRDDVEAQAAAAAQEYSVLFTRFGSVSQDLGRKEDAERKARARCEELGIALACPLAVAGPDHAQEEAALAEAEALDHDRIATEAEGAAARELETTRVAATALAALRLVTQSAGTLRDHWEDQFPGDAAPTSIAFPADDALDTVATRLEEAFRALRSAAKDLDRRRRAAVGAINAIVIAPEAEDLRSAIPRRFRAFDEHALELQSATLLQELDNRRQILDAEIEGLDRHRSVLISEALTVAGEAVRLLRDAEKQSRLPAHLPFGGGECFLRITTSLPETPAGEAERLGDLIDELVREGTLPTGIEFVQQAVRRLAKPIRAKVMFPEPGVGTRIVDIPETARFSGGEQLTCAILLYCTLAQLRVKRRAAAKRPSSVLLLDNPIGRASRASFLELQREVASAMNIQLIYTTGVEDLEAIRALPNVIRLRNERVDRNTGNQVVELVGDAPVGEVTAARIARVDSRPVGVGSGG